MDILCHGANQHHCPWLTLERRSRALCTIQQIIHGKAAFWRMCAPCSSEHRSRRGKGTNGAKETRQLKATWDGRLVSILPFSERALLHQLGTLEKRICKVDKCYFENYIVENVPLFLIIYIIKILSQDYRAECLQLAFKKFSLGEHRMVSMSLRPA